jgi:hypothetical protein
VSEPAEVKVKKCRRKFLELEVQREPSDWSDTASFRSPRRHDFRFSKRTPIALVMFAAPRCLEPRALEETPLIVFA